MGATTIFCIKNFVVLSMKILGQMGKDELH